jgi:hypothetical protein
MRVAICCDGDSPNEVLRDALMLGGALSARGHSVHFVAGDPVALVDQAGSWIPSNIHQAPLLKPSPPLAMKRAPVDGLADAMAAAGFEEKRILLTLAAVWRDQLGLLQPDVVVAFGGPVAWLVGPTVAPTLAIGSGMALPPVLGSSFPRLSADSVELADERVMLANANAVLARFGKPSLAALSEVVSNCDTLLYGLPTFDPYLQLRRSVTVGALGAMRLPLVPAPEKRVVAFLDAYCPGIETTILAFPALEDVRLDIHITRATSGMRRFLEQQPGVKVWADHGELLEQAGGARLIVHHGDQDIAQSAIYGGQPQLVFPWTRQQEILTYMIGWMGVMKTQASTSPIAQISEALSSALLDSSLNVAAQHHARQFSQVGIPNALPIIIERVEGMPAVGA